MIQALLSLYFVLVFRREAKVAGKNSWKWAFIGGLCFFASSSLTTLVVGRTAVHFWTRALGDDAILLVFGAIGVGLVLGFLVTSVVKDRYLTSNPPRSRILGESE